MVKIVKKQEFIRFDWVQNYNNSIPGVDTQANNYFGEHPNFKIIDYKFKAYEVNKEPVEALIVRYEYKINS